MPTLDLGLIKGAPGETGVPGAPGATGQQGIQGEPGTAATVEIGTVVTGAAGSNVEVTNTGTKIAAVLNFKIPQGDRGSAGQGVPAGGAAGQILRKGSTEDYDAQWDSGYLDLSGNLPNTGWSGSAAPYTKTVAVSGVKAGMKPVIDVVLSSTWATAVTQEKEWGHIKRISVADDVLTFYADAVPAVALDFQGVGLK